MRSRFLTGLHVLAALCLVGSVAAQGVPEGKGAAAIALATKNNKTVFVVFFRDWDAKAQAVAQTVKATVDKHAAQATWTSVAITDPAEKPIVDKFQVSRAPMPLLLVVHPNGAVTGAYQKPVAEADLAQCLVSPKKAECMKALQDNQLVLLCVQTAPQAPAPQGVMDFKADPQFASRTQIVTMQLNDPAEAAFLPHLQIDPKVQAPATVFMAPPGVMVGKFPATATKADLGKALHAAGKCCDDKNCKHNH